MTTRKLKTPELLEAKQALLDFLRVHNLDPLKDYSRDPQFGAEFRKLLYKLNKERDKIALEYPLTDIKNFKKYVKMKKDKKLKRAAKQQAATTTPVEEKATPKKEKATPKRIVKKYDYPLIDGKEMTAAEKKKYRAEQRRIAKDNSEIESLKKEIVVKDKKIKKVVKKDNKEED